MDNRIILTARMLQLSFVPHSIDYGDNESAPTRVRGASHQALVRHKSTTGDCRRRRIEALRMTTTHFQWILIELSIYNLCHARQYLYKKSKVLHVSLISDVTY